MKSRQYKNGAFLTHLHTTIGYANTAGTHPYTLWMVGATKGGGAKMVGQRGTHTLYKKWCVLTLTTIGFANTAGTHPTRYYETN